jgi:hypothetical protein
MNVDPASAVAVNVTDESCVNARSHVPGQLIPRGEVATRPVPVPSSVTDNVEASEGVAETSFECGLSPAVLAPETT